MCASYRLCYRLRRSGGAADALLLEGEDGQGYFYAQGALQLALPLPEATGYLATLDGVEAIVQCEHDECWFTRDELHRRWLDSGRSVSDLPEGSAIMAELTTDDTPAQHRHGAAFPSHPDEEHPAPVSLAPLPSRGNDRDVSAA